MQIASCLFCGFLVSIKSSTLQCLRKGLVYKDDLQIILSLNVFLFVIFICLWASTHKHVIDFVPSSSYVQNNVRQHHTSRAYDPELQDFLINMPQRLAQHTTKRLQEVCQMDKSDITLTSDGHFHVKSQSQEGVKYYVSFDGTYPECECLDFVHIHAM